MSKLLVVLPVILKQTTDICIESLLRADSAAGLKPDEILLVDNSKKGDWAQHYGLEVYRDPEGHNLGVARSWNVGAERVLEGKLDYLVLMSASMRFGPIMHTTWRRQMKKFWGATAIEADGHSWHLIAIHRSVFETIGIFDGNFYPAYFEAIDFAYRMRMKDLENMWPRVWVNALSQGVALHNQLVSVPAPPLLQYYAEKWGGPKGEETFTQPFGNRPLDYWQDLTIPQLASKYGLDNWW